MLSTEYREHSK